MVTRAERVKDGWLLEGLTVQLPGYFRSGRGPDPASRPVANNPEPRVFALLPVRRLFAKSGNSRYMLAQNQLVNLVRSFVGVD
jgi:hypothetical protein